MPRQGNGTYVLPAGNPVTPSTLIRSEWANSTLTDISNALTQSLSKDGQTTPTADLPMGGFKHISVDPADAVGQYVESRQAQNWDLYRLVNGAGSTGTAYDCTLILGSNSWDDGTSFIFNPTVANTGAATISINGSTPAPILSSGGLPLVAGDIVSGAVYYIRKLGVNWYLIPFTSTGGVGDYVLKTGDTMTGPLSISTPSGASSLSVTAAAGDSYVSIGFPPRAPSGVPYTLDNGRYGEAYTITYNSLNGTAIRLIAAGSVNTLDSVPMSPDGSIPATASTPFLIRLNNSSGVLFTAVTIDNLGSITANYKISGRLFLATHFQTSLSAGPITLDMSQYQSWSLSLGGDTQFDIVNLTLGQVVRVLLTNTANKTVTWTVNSGGGVVSWSNGSANQPPNSTEIGAGPLDACMFTFWRTSSTVVIGQWAAY